MQPRVILESVSREESLVAVDAPVRLDVGRPAGVDPAVIAYSALGDEALAADRADEREVAGVTAQVGGQAAALLEQATAFRAAVALLRRVGAQVRTESARRRVRSTTHRTTVRLHPGVTQLMYLHTFNAHTVLCVCVSSGDIVSPLARHTHSLVCVCVEWGHCVPIRHTHRTSWDNCTASPRCDSADVPTHIQHTRSCVCVEWGHCVPTCNVCVPTRCVCVSVYVCVFVGPTFGDFSEFTLPPMGTVPGLVL